MSKQNANAEAIQALLAEVRANLDRIEALLDPRLAAAKLDPKNPLNKDGANLTPRGAEIAYRMFDAGYTRYAVAAALDISYGAANHRLRVWNKLGGKDRRKQALKALKSGLHKPSSPP